MGRNLGRIRRRRRNWENSVPDRAAVNIYLGRAVVKVMRYTLAACTFVIVCSILLSLLTWPLGSLKPSGFAIVEQVAIIGFLASYGVGVLLVFLWPNLYKIERRSWLENMFDRRSGIGAYFPRVVTEQVYDANKPPSDQA